MGRSWDESCLLTEFIRAGVLALLASFSRGSYLPNEYHLEFLAKAVVRPDTRDPSGTTGGSCSLQQLARTPNVELDSHIHSHQ